MELASRLQIPTKHYPLLFTNDLYVEHLQRCFRQREAPPRGGRAALGTASLASAEQGDGWNPQVAALAAPE